MIDKAIPVNQLRIIKRITCSRIGNSHTFLFPIQINVIHKHYLIVNRRIVIRILSHRSRIDNLIRESSLGICRRKNHLGKVNIRTPDMTVEHKILRIVL